MRKMMIAAAALAGLMGTSALAQQADANAMGPMHDGIMGASFADLDSDGSGGVTLEELQARPAARFAAADTNSDGALSVEEIQAALLRQMAEGMVSRLDANGDGLVQIEEMQPQGGMGLDRMFDLADADNDGTVTEAEFDAIKTEMQTMRGHGLGDGRGHGEGHGRGHGEGRGFGGFFGFGGN